MQLFFNIVLGCVLVYIAIIDGRTHKITNRSLLVLLMAGLAAAWELPVAIEERILGAMVCGGLLLLIDLVVPGSFGGGDIKLLVIAGGLLGWKSGFLALCAGFLTGGAYGAFMLAAGKMKKKDKLALGPFLCMGIAAAYCIFFVNSNSTVLTY